jgi:hypothetical protein
MGILLTVVILVVLLGGVLAFARVITKRATRGTASQAANLFTRYPESRSAPDEENTRPPRLIGPPQSYERARLSASKPAPAPLDDPPDGEESAGI